MKKILFILICLAITNCSVYAGLTTEKDIGACTVKNSKGWCIESKTHTCYNVDSHSGKCTAWTIKNGDQFKDVMRQFGEYNEEIIKGAGSKTTNNTNKKTSYVGTKQNTNVNAQAEKEKLEKHKYEKAQRATIPYSLAILQEEQKVRKEIYTLLEKQRLGVNVAEDLDVLNYKDSRLNTLDNQCDTFDKIYKALNDGTITQDEYNKLESNIRAKDYALKDEYTKIISATAKSIKEEKEQMEAQAKAEEKKAKKIEVGKRLINQGTLYVPPSASNWIKQGVDALELLK